MHLGSNDFRTKYMSEKVTEWCNKLKTVSEYAKLQPQATYAAFCFGEQNKFSYFLRTIPEMKDLKKPVDEIVQKFLPLAIIDETISKLFSEKTCNELENSFTITALLVPLFITQDTSLPNAVENKRRY